MDYRCGYCQKLVTLPDSHDGGDRAQPRVYRGRLSCAACHGKDYAPKPPPRASVDGGDPVVVEVLP